MVSMVKTAFALIPLCFFIYIIYLSISDHVFLIICVLFHEMDATLIINDLVLSKKISYT